MRAGRSVGSPSFRWAGIEDGARRRLDRASIGWHWSGLASSAQWLARWLPPRTRSLAPMDRRMGSGAGGPTYKGAFDYPFADWRGRTGAGAIPSRQIRSPNHLAIVGVPSFIPPRPLPSVHGRERLSPLGGHHLAVRTPCPAPAGRSDHPEYRPECRAHGRDCGQRQLVDPRSSPFCLY